MRKLLAAAFLVWIFGWQGPSVAAYDACSEAQLNVELRYSDLPDLALCFAQNDSYYAQHHIDAETAQGFTYSWLLTVGWQPMPGAQAGAAADFKQSFGFSMQIGNKVGGNFVLNSGIRYSSIFWDLQSGHLALSRPVFPLFASYVQYQRAPYAPAFNSTLLNPPLPNEFDAASQPRRYLRAILTMSYYIFNWAYGFDFVNSGRGSAASLQAQNDRTARQAKVSDTELQQFSGYTAYILAVARYLLPYVNSFDGVPVSQQMLVHLEPQHTKYQRMLGNSEQGAYYVGNVTHSYKPANVQQCAQDCYSSAKSFYQCRAQPFTSLSPTGDPCGLSPCDGWRMCTGPGSCLVYPHYSSLDLSLPDRLHDVPFVYTTPSSISSAQSFLAVYSSKPAAPSYSYVAYGQYMYGGYTGHGSYGGYCDPSPSPGPTPYGAPPPPVPYYGAPTPPIYQAAAPQTCEHLRIFEASDVLGQTDRWSGHQDVRGGIAAGWTSGRFVPFPTGYQEM